ncbi:hypothetical protein GJR96_01035 [Haloferax sp. MBLA0076]|uniref:DUF7322 domain-containing protein n=1 Tax=Haloferax litoreum TaxID=2666140 RepID=A0A6A8GBC7_9EURY|nr:MULTISPECIES: hypothetical protein [Haloferax]KAB1192097.1 hypothetical protein Hfx1148_01035 [Haloferax sp. CBA1148]MRX20544.1 hypothetical protein [Haloferax litoreum]
MTDDERRGDESETTDSSPEREQNAERSAHDVASPTDRVKRWSDPESRWGNPENDLPNIPHVSVPGEDPDSGLVGDFRDDDVSGFSADVDPEVSRIFWASVVLANIGLAGLALGPMLVYFRGQVLIGGGVTLLGIGALVRVYYMYQEYKETDWASDDEDSNASSDDDADRGERNR